MTMLQAAVPQEKRHSCSKENTSIRKTISIFGIRKGEDILKKKRQKRKCLLGALIRKNKKKD